MWPSSSVAAAVRVRGVEHRDARVGRGGDRLERDAPRRGPRRSTGACSRGRCGAPSRQPKTRPGQRRYLRLGTRGPGSRLCASTGKRRHRPQRRIMKATSRARVYVPLSLFLFIVMAATFASASAANTCPSVKPVCGAVPLGHMRCFALQFGNAQPFASTPSGYGPADLQSAYNLPSTTAGAGQTVAIVDAFDDPNAESDLAAYRSQFGCRRAPRPTAASARSTRAAARSPARRRTPAGRRRSRSTSTWSRRRARTARSCSSRRPRT